jgi:hypothetical protein
MQARRMSNTHQRQDQELIVKLSLHNIISVGHADPFCCNGKRLTLFWGVVAEAVLQYC